MNRGAACAESAEWGVKRGYRTLPRNFCFGSRNVYGILVHSPAHLCACFCTVTRPGQTSSTPAQSDITG